MVQLMLPPIPGNASSAYDGLNNFVDTTALKKLRAEKMRDRSIPPPPLPNVQSMIKNSDDLVKTALNIITKDFEVRRPMDIEAASNAVVQAVSICVERSLASSQTPCQFCTSPGCYGELHVEKRMRRGRVGCGELM